MSERTSLMHSSEAAASTLRNGPGRVEFEKTDRSGSDTMGRHIEPAWSLNDGYVDRAHDPGGTGEAGIVREGDSREDES
jgi:hypothetical protein